MTCESIKLICHSNSWAETYLHAKPEMTVMFIYCFVVVVIGFVFILGKNVCRRMFYF